MPTDSERTDLEHTERIDDENYHGPESIDIKTELQAIIDKLTARRFCGALPPKFTTEEEAAEHLLKEVFTKAHRDYLKAAASHKAGQDPSTYQQLATVAKKIRDNGASVTFDASDEVVLSAYASRQFTTTLRYLKEKAQHAPRDKKKNKPR